MLSHEGFALVPGAPLPVDPLVTIKVLRGFYNHEGQPLPVGAVARIPSRLAKEVCSMRKAELVPDVPAPEPIPANTVNLQGTLTIAPPASENVRPLRRRGGSSHG